MRAAEAMMMEAVMGWMMPVLCDQRRRASRRLHKKAVISAYQAQRRLDVAALRRRLEGFVAEGRLKQAGRCEAEIALLQRLAERGPIR